MSDCPEKCPVSVRLDGLKEEFERHRTEEKLTHKEMFQRIGDLEQDVPVLETLLKANGEKLTEVNENVKALLEKPSKRWETLVGCFFSAIVGAFLLWLVAGMPGA